MYEGFKHVFFTHILIPELVADCKWLYKQVSSDKMSRGLPYFMDTVVERTGDPALQRINISWCKNKILMIINN